MILEKNNKGEKKRREILCCVTQTPGISLTYKGNIFGSQKLIHSKLQRPTAESLSDTLAMGKTGGSSMSSSWFTALKRAFIYSPTKKNPKRITSGRDDLEHFEEGEDKVRVSGRSRLLGFLWQAMLPDKAPKCFSQGKGKRKWAIQRDAANRELVACPRKTTRTTAEAAGKASSDVIEMAIATTTAAEAAVATARAALEALPLASKRPFPSTLDHQSATIIQTAFRGYLVKTDITNSCLFS